MYLILYVPDAGAGLSIDAEQVRSLAELGIGVDLEVLHDDGSDSSA